MGVYVLGLINPTQETSAAQVDEPIDSQCPVPINYSNENIVSPPYCGADGHEIKLINNITAMDPTYGEVIDFIKYDQTDTLPYQKGVFTCGDYAEIVHNDAENASVKCAWVTIILDDGRARACNTFNTTDKGLIWVDCTVGDGILYPVPANGDQYIPESLSPNQKYKSMGTIAEYHTYW